MTSRFGGPAAWLHCCTVELQAVQLYLSVDVALQSCVNEIFRVVHANDTTSKDS